MLSMIKSLPENYTDMPPADFVNANSLSSSCNIDVVVLGSQNVVSDDEKYLWLPRAAKLLDQHDVGKDNLSLSAYFASQQDAVTNQLLLH